MKQIRRTTSMPFKVFSSLVLLLLLGAPCSTWLAPKDPYASNLLLYMQPPSPEYLMGTDMLGRDVLSRIIYGSGISIGIALTVVVIMSLVGTLLGAMAGFHRGYIETVIMRLADIMLAFPNIIFAIVIAGILGGSIGGTIFALSVVGWAKYARLSRSLVLQVMQEDFITASIVSGATSWMVLKRHVLPSMLPFITVTAAMDMGTVMLEVAGLSFIGFGAQPPTPDWGLMLNEGRQYFFSAPWLMIFPGLAIFIVVSIFNIWGDSLRDWLDPQYR